MSATKQDFVKRVHPYLSPITPSLSLLHHFCCRICYIHALLLHGNKKDLMRLRPLHLPPPLDTSAILPQNTTYTSPHFFTHHAKLTFPSGFKQFLLRDNLLRIRQIGLLSFVSILLIFGPATTLSLIVPQISSIHRIRRFPTDASMGPTFAARVHSRKFYCLKFFLLDLKPRPLVNLQVMSLL